MGDELCQPLLLLASAARRLSDIHPLHLPKSALAHFQQLVLLFSNAFAMRTSDGCWTCRLRRKKCDETRPVCEVCAGLDLTCYLGQTRPSWMDGGKRQNDMAEKLKADIKARARRRRGAEASYISRTGMPTPENPDHYQIPDSELVLSTKDTTHSKQYLPTVFGTNHQASKLDVARDTLGETTVPPTDVGLGLGLANDPISTGRDVWNSVFIGHSEATLIMFYLDEVFPWLYPFYRPSLVQGGRFWILEMMSSPVVRQTALCQSNYFYLLAQHGGNCYGKGARVLEQTNEAFTSLREALQVVMGASIADHMQCAARVMTGIVQIYRFEIAISSFLNWQTHLSAALKLLSQILEAAEPAFLAESDSRPDSVSIRLGHSSAEKAAFRFSSALLVLDDVVASIVFQREPRLYNRHPELLGTADHCGSIDLEGVLGLQNRVVLQLGQIAALSAWKQSCRNAGSLDVMELVSRATPIKGSLVAILTGLHVEEAVTPAANASNALHLLTSQNQGFLAAVGDQSGLITRLWAHAALIYLSVVVSGWQHRDSIVRSRVASIIDAVTGKPLRPALMHTIVWPLCVAGCFAESSQRESLRSMIHALQPRSMFGTLCKALELMEQTWYNDSIQDGVDNMSWCFQSQGEQILLV